MGFSTRTFRVRHNPIDMLYTICALEPSEVILLMAGAQPKKVIMWDAALLPRPLFSGTRD